MREDVYNEVRRHMENDIKVNYAEVARRMDCDPRTAKRYVTEKPVRKNAGRKKLIDDYKQIITEKVDNFAVSSAAVYEFIKKKGFKGSYPTVRRFIKAHKAIALKKATIRFETVPGLQAQVDWKEEFKLVNKNGELFVFNIFLYILGFSRGKYVSITFDRKQDTLFKCLTEAFNYTNGVPQEIWFDNMTTVVDRPNTRVNNMKLNTKMQQFSKDFNFIANVCKAYRPQTKGKVEAVARLMERLQVFNNEFYTVEDLIGIVQEFNNQINEQICQSTRSSPNVLLKKEKEYLQPLPNKDIMDCYCQQRIQRKVSNESMITYNDRKYSVPVDYIGETVEVIPYENHIQIYSNNTLIFSHPISRKNFNYDKEHLKQILFSDAFKYKSDSFVEDYAKRHLEELDKLLEV